MTISLRCVGIGMAEGRCYIKLKDEVNNEFTWFPEQDEIDGIAAFAPPSGSIDRSIVRKEARLAHTIYTKAQGYLREGDWARYGKELKRLGTALERLVRLATGQE